MQPEDEQKSEIDKAKKVFVWVIVGMVIVFGVAIMMFMLSAYYMSDIRGEQRRINQRAAFYRQPTMEYP